MERPAARAIVAIAIGFALVAVVQLTLPHLPGPSHGVALRLDAYLSTFVFFTACALAACTLCAFLDGEPAWRPALVLGIGVAIGVVGTLTHGDVVATLGRLLAAGCAGLLLARMIEELWWVAMAALVVALADIWSVFSPQGVTNHIVKHAPETLHWATIPVPIAGVPLDSGTFVGVTDLLFLALFLAVAWRWQLSLERNIVVLALSFVATLVIDAELLTGRAVPALPLLSIAVVVVNAPQLLASWRTRARRS